MSEIDEGLQDKIGEWWAGLTDKERKAFIEPGLHFGKNSLLLAVQKTEVILYTIGDSHVWAQSLRHFLLYKKPAPCPQFWWKLEAWITGKTYTLINFNGLHWKYKKENINVNHEDRRHALLDAALAVQKEVSGV